MDEQRRLRALRGAYETGRAVLALRALAVGSLFVLVTLWRGGDRVSLGASLAVALLAAAALYRGLGPGRAVWPALAVAGLAYGGTMLVMGGAMCPMGACLAHCLPRCGGVGLAAGLTLYGLRRGPSPSGAATSFGIVLLACIAACPCLGVGSSLGYALGIGLPTLAAAFAPASRGA